jgi:thiosulfate reductase cytochrome b subunit
VICLSVVTGLSIWKPVQLGWLTALFDGYPMARRIHLAMMALPTKVRSRYRGLFLAWV